MLPRKILKFTVSEIAGNACNFKNHLKISSHLCLHFVSFFNNNNSELYLHDYNNTALQKLQNTTMNG